MTRQREAPSLGSAVVVDSHWYAEMLGGPAVALEEVVTRMLPGSVGALVMRFGALRGLVLGALSYRATAVGVIKNTLGVSVALAVAGLHAQRSRLVLLEFIRRPLPRGGGSSSRTWRAFA